MLQFVSCDCAFYPSVDRRKQWLNGPRVPARFCAESNDSSRIANIIGRRLEGADNSSVFMVHRNYHLSRSSHTSDPNRGSRLRLDTDNNRPSCWSLESWCQLYAHDCENYRHYCESDRDVVFQCQSIQSWDYHDR